MTWTSTICVVVMATYGRTLCWKKRNTVPNTGGVFAVGEKNKCRRRACCQGRLKTMNDTDLEGLGVESLGVVLVCSGPSGASLAVTAPPNRCPRTVPSSTGRGSRKPGPG